MRFLAIIRCVIIASFVATDAYIPRMIRGRPRGGLVGSPRNKHHDGNTVRKPSTPPDMWFTQKLDHFNGADTRTWKQRYFVNNTYFQTGGPLFVHIGGEATANPIWMLEGAWIVFGYYHNAYLALLEHRFYGKSHPTEDMSTENLQYLSSEQALADLAAFITDLKQKLGNPRVIVFGGSYPGSLAAWFRLKYPHLADGAIASSAPLRAVIDFTEYLEVVDNALRTYDSKGSCNDAISNATVSIQKALKTLEGRTDIKNKFKLCDVIDPNIKSDIANLYSTLAGNFMGVVQYNRDNRAFEGALGTNITIDTVCNIMTDSALGNPVDRYAQVNTLLMQVASEKCQDFRYEKMIDDMRIVNWNSSAAEGGRQWTYQTCTEFAFYQSSDSNNQPFGHGFPIETMEDQVQRRVSGPVLIERDQKIPENAAPMTDNEVIRIQNGRIEKFEPQSEV